MKKSLAELFAHIENLDTRSAQFLMRALETHNQPGFDYIEFKQSLGVLSSMNMEEGTAVKSAFATASTMGLTRDKLFQSASNYKEILSREKSQFDVALKNQIQQKVGAKEEENKRYAIKLKQIEEQIQRLQQETQTIQQRIKDNEQIKNTESEKLNRQKDKFESTFHLIQAEIDEDLEKFKLYL